MTRQFGRKNFPKSISLFFVQWLKKKMNIALMVLS